MVRSQAPAAIQDLTDLQAKLPWLLVSEVSEWRERLREVAIRYRDVGHDWQFNFEQRQLLQQYHEANILLFDCMKEGRTLTNATRQHIEDTLLLPWDEAYPETG